MIDDKNVLLLSYIHECKWDIYVYDMSNIKADAAFFSQSRVACYAVVVSLVIAKDLSSLRICWNIRGRLNVSLLI
jgi:hypothetical protein